MSIISYSDLCNSIELAKPPDELTIEIKALWYERKGNWDKAHELVQWREGAKSAWVHAYLHRKEPDLMNARYWYSRAGKNIFTGSFEDEWQEIALNLLATQK